MNSVMVCTSCGAVLHDDEIAGHYCNPRRIAELEWRVADLTRRLDAAERAWALAAGIRAGRDMLTPGTTQVCEVIPFEHPARHAQVTRQPGRAASRTLGHGRSPVTSLPQRAPAGGVVA